MLKLFWSLCRYNYFFFAVADICKSMPNKCKVSSDEGKHLLYVFYKYNCNW